MTNKGSIEAIFEDVRYDYIQELMQRRMTVLMSFTKDFREDFDDLFRIKLIFSYKLDEKEQELSCHPMDVEFGDGVICIYFDPIDDTASIHGIPFWNPQSKEDIEQYFTNWRGAQRCIGYIFSKAMEYAVADYDIELNNIKSRINND